MVFDKPRSHLCNDGFHGQYRTDGSVDRDKPIDHRDGIRRSGDAYDEGASRRIPRTSLHDRQGVGVGHDDSIDGPSALAKYVAELSRCLGIVESSVITHGTLLGA